MADICKCANMACNKRHLCYRATANDSHWQSYSSFDCSEEDSHYWPNDEYEKLETEGKLKDEYKYRK